MASQVQKLNGFGDQQKHNKSSELLDKISANKSPEFVFAVVGYAGSGTSKVASQLQKILNVQKFETIILKAREGLDNYSIQAGKTSPLKIKSKLEQVCEYQNLGDLLRERTGEYSAVAAYMVRRIKDLREDVIEKKVYIMDSIKHPTEVRLLRDIYGENFCLIGVGCRPDIRRKRLLRKFDLDAVHQKEELDAFIDRDNEDSDHNHGQKVSETFHLSDYFVDNTISDEDEHEFTLIDKLKRLIDLLFTGNIHRPENDERGLYHAHAASLRSSCLSRQVGAAIMDFDGNLLSVGTNDVPRKGGGLYGNHDKNDDRCFVERGKCSNTVKQIEIIDDLKNRLIKKGLMPDKTTSDEFKESIKGSRLGSLIEFSRSVHAEMDALLTLVRKGVKLNKGASLYSTTYPCHNCARHIVASGIEKVVYLEPYAKSLAIDLHDDSIADNLPSDKAEGKVVFIPYQGVSPLLYSKIFCKTGELKNKEGVLLDPSEVEHHKNTLLTKSYLELECDVVKFLEDFEEGVSGNEKEQK